MANIVQNQAFSSLPLDTLGQLPTKDLKNLWKRARSKWYTTAIVGRLLFLGSSLNSYYQRAFYCSHILKQEGNKITAKYCDTRVCHICNRIRTARLMNHYVDQLLNLGEIEFVTLTVPNCSAAALNTVVDEMIKKSSNINRVFRERRNLDISGIRKLEITYNADKDSYHPHLHILVSGGIGNEMVDEWLKRNPDASIKAQDVRPADQKSLNELFKYTTKIAVKQKQALTVYIPALDVILRSLSGRRCFQPFGKIRAVDEEITGLQSEEYEGIPEYDFVEWIWDECDWVNGKETLTGYISPDFEINFVE